MVSKALVLSACLVLIGLAGAQTVLQVSTWMQMRTRCWRSSGHSAEAEVSLAQPLDVCI